LVRAPGFGGMDSRISRAVLLIAGFGLGCPQASDDGADPVGDGAGTDGTVGGGETTGGGDADDADDDDDDDDAADDDSSGGEPSPTGPFIDGDRIKAVVSRSPEGLEAFEGWWDSELEQYCFWGDVGGGELRCLPQSFGSPGFADAGCTEPAVAAGCSIPDVVTRWVEPFCPGTPAQYTVWTVGEAADTLFIRNGNDECVAWGDVGGYRLLPRGVEEYERADVEFVELGELARYELSADDGTRMWTGPYTAEGDEFCEIREVDGSSRCVSYNRAFQLTNFHTDAGCANADVLSNTAGAECNAPEIGVLADGEVVGVGESLDGQTIYSGDVDSCSELTTRFALPLFSVAPADVDALPQAEIALEGDGRLQLRRPVSTDGDVLGLSSPAWHDSELGFTCVGQSVGDSTVCRPSQTAPASDFFSDAGCEALLLRQGNLLPGWYSRFEYGDTCEPSTFLEAVRIGNPYTGAAWRLTDTGCESLEDPESYAPLFAIEERVGPSGLATLEF